MPSLHPLHRVWRSLPAGLRRSALARVTAAAGPHPDPVPPPVQPGLCVCGEIERDSGLGQAARLMMEAVRSLGLPAWPLDTALTLPGESAHAPGVLPPAGVPLLMTYGPPVLPASLLKLPRGTLAGRRIVAHWAWELPVLPPVWRHGARLVHDIWAPSRFTAAALDPLAPGRVRVVPHPVALLPPLPSPRGRAEFGLPRDAFIVLTSFSLASSCARKNPVAAIRAFRQAFGNDSGAMLVLKIAHTEYWPDDLAAIRSAAGDAVNIRIMAETLKQDDAHALTCCADAVLSLHRSEGFGLVPAEAMLLGVPVIATDWSATAEFIDAGNGIPVPYTLVPARDPRGVFEADGAVWAEADTEFAARALRDLAANKERRRELGEAARLSVARRFGAAPVRDALLSLGMDLPS